MKTAWRWTWLVILLWTGLQIAGLLTRSFIPIDETRYVSVAWEMWINDSYLVPIKNGEPYSHKPPLLFWLIHLGWWLLGVNDWWPRLVAPLFALGSSALVLILGRRLHPKDEAAGETAGWLLFGSLLWCTFASAAMFDMLIVFFTLLGLIGVIQVWQEGSRSGWLWLGLAIGLGVLAKGPIILLHSLPVPLLAPWWMGEQRPASWRAWYAGVLGALLLGAALALAWALPAALAGGETYARAILWRQTAGRIVESFAHDRPFWWYFPLLPLLWLPLSLWSPFWRGLISVRSSLRDPAIRFCLAWILAVLFGLSLISGKQVHYLLPIFPAFALLVAFGLKNRPIAVTSIRIPMILGLGLGLGLLLLPKLSWISPDLWWLPALSQSGGWLLLIWSALGLAIARSPQPERNFQWMSASGPVWLLALSLALAPALAPAYDLREVSRLISGLQSRGLSLANVGEYHAQFQFLGRLRQPILEIKDSAEVASRWLAEHPKGALIQYPKHWSPDLSHQYAYAQRYRQGALVISLGAEAAGSGF